MESTLLISDNCIGCGKCVKVCIRGHLRVEDRKVREVESAYSCFRCGHCEAICPKGAITLRQGDAPEGIDGCPVSAEDMAKLLRTRRSIRWFDGTAPRRR